MTSNETPNVALEQLKSEEQSELMNAIDHLRSNGFDKKLDLPQLIVCGNQSSGKSSVLEAISRMPFPAGSGLTTKFATEIILRSATHRKDEVFIVPGVNTPENIKAVLRKRQDELQGELSENGDLSKVLEMAVEHMTEPNNAMAFSSHRLRVERFGPDQPDLTLVDLPGLIATTTHATQANDIELVAGMVKGYMDQPRSIILAVASCAIDLETQPVFELARKVDPRGRRTVGILTMPDRVQKGDEPIFIEWAKNRRLALELGWHVLKNRNSAEKSPCSRDELETRFFNDTGNPWNGVRPDDRGIDTLRAKLRDILLEHISKSLPKLVQDIDSEVRTCESQLKEIGPARDSIDERERYFYKLCQRHVSLVENGVKAYYDDPFFKKTINPTLNPRLVRTRMRELIDDFSMSMRDSGCLIHDTGDAEGFCEIHHRHVRTSDVVIDPEGEPLCATTLALTIAVKKYLDTYRGLHLEGEYSDRAIGEVFQAFSNPWEQAARRYADRSFEMATRFFRLVLEEAAGKHTAKIVFEEIVSAQFLACKSKLDDKVSEILSPFKTVFPFTSNPRFLLDSRGLDTNAQPTTAHLNEWNVIGILNRVHALYDLTICTFIDNMTMLAVENCVLKPLQEMFTYEVVQDISRKEPSRFERLSSEPKGVEQRRSELIHSLQALRSVRGICNKHAPLEADDFETARPAGSRATGQNHHTTSTNPQAPAQTTDIPHVNVRNAKSYSAAPPEVLTPPRTPEPRSTSPKQTPERASPGNPASSSSGQTTSIAFSQPSAALTYSSTSESEPDQAPSSSNAEQPSSSSGLRPAPSSKPLGSFGQPSSTGSSETYIFGSSRSSSPPSGQELFARKGSPPRTAVATIYRAMGNEAEDNADSPL